MSDFISLNQAIDMTTLYRSEKDNILKTEYENQAILPICETFDRADIEALLNKEGCEYIRVYYGMDENLSIHAILVAVNDAEEDMLPTSYTTTEDIVDEAQRCPFDCPPESPLNS